MNWGDSPAYHHGVVQHMCSICADEEEMPTKNPAAVALGKRGGKVKSKAKAAAARKNGKLGGRPKSKGGETR